MNTLNKVYSKLNSEKKTELANHKIELGLIDDIIKDYKKAAAKGVPLKKQANDIGNKLIDVNIELLAINKRAEKAAEKAKELGAKSILGQMNSIADASKSIAKGYNKGGSKIINAAKEI
tara:strand:+ start:443 stop:799 length:357 start_codon:yes stop_codon:yes gene_type:complete